MIESDVQEQPLNDSILSMSLMSEHLWIWMKVWVDIHSGIHNRIEQKDLRTPKVI
jgi:hypothetical protein